MAFIALVHVVETFPATTKVLFGKKESCATATKTKEDRNRIIAAIGTRHLAVKVSMRLWIDPLRRKVSAAEVGVVDIEL